MPRGRKKGYKKINNKKIFCSGVLFIVVMFLNPLSEAFFSEIWLPHNLTNIKEYFLVSYAGIHDHIQ